MSSHPMDTSTTPPLRIDGEMTIFRAAELKQQLMAQPGLVALDLSGVTEIDTAGVQLLLMLQLAAQARQATLTLLQPSASVAELLDLLELGPRFGLPDAKVAA